MNKWRGISIAFIVTQPWKAANPPIATTGPGLATISWTTATGTNWVLQESASLSPAAWINSPSAFTNLLVVLATWPAKFYHLFKP